MEKLSMGEYTLVVWAAYLVAFVLLGGCAALSLRGLRQAQKILRELGE